MSTEPITATTTFLELFDRMPDLVRDAVGELDADQLARRVDPEANTVAWLLWHLARVEDDHVSAAAEALELRDHARQVYISGEFAQRFHLPFDPSTIGYGQSSDEVAEVTADGDLLIDYYEAVHTKTVDFLGDLDLVGDDVWERIVDERWDPPVTLLSRMTSVANEVAQHVGQAAFVRGVVERN